MYKTDEIVRKVRARHPYACANTDTTQAKVTVGYHNGRDIVLGVGRTYHDAWEDALRNVQREPLPSLTVLGSPTQSLRSDEANWKGRRHAKALP